MQTKTMRVYYLIWALVLFGTEILIGTVWSGWYWLRAYGGDILVIPLIYCMIRIFTAKLPRLMPFLVCCTGFLAEFLQYIHLADLLGFAHGSLPAILIGTSFSWLDMLCYIAGMGLIYLMIAGRLLLTRHKKGVTV